MNQRDHDETCHDVSVRTHARTHAGIYAIMAEIFGCLSFASLIGKLGSAMVKRHTPGGHL